MCTVGKNGRIIAMQIFNQLALVQRHHSNIRVLDSSNRASILSQLQSTEEKKTQRKTNTIEKSKKKKQQNRCEIDILLLKNKFDEQQQQW